MRILGKIYSMIQSHIATTFSVLLIVTFVLVFFVFNFSVNRYIEGSAIYALRVARAEAENAPAPAESFIMRLFRRGSELPHVYPHGEQYSTAGSEGIVFRQIGERMQLAYYVWNDYPNEGYPVAIFYTDITEARAFAALIRRISAVSLLAVWFLSTLVAGILSDSLMRPLRLLRDFVRQIGRGDFTPNEHKFVNEEFDELNQCLNSTARQLAAYDNKQKAFFQNVSHELRTPLTVIKMYGEGIQSGVMDATAATTILEAEARLANMVDDILYISRLDSVSAPPMEEINLRITVEECIRQQRPVAEVRGIEIRYTKDEPVMVNCAMNHMERAVNNLISNAIRFAKTAVSIECYAIGGVATVRVSDDGPGFEPDALPHVFERFYRGKGGLSGIGLSTVKSVIDMHKGIATAENGENSGAVLTISIPRKK